jgi:hypothetical protein
MTVTVQPAATAVPANASRQALETCLLDTNATYQGLLTQPGALDQCREAGRSLRCLAQCLAGFERDDGEDEADDFLDALNEDD